MDQEKRAATGVGRDVAFVVGKAVAAVAASSVGLGAAAELLELLRIPLQKRQAALLAEVAERLRELENQGRLTVDDVVQSDAFVTAAIRALEVARRTTETEKRRALRNALVNVALAQAPEDALTQYFLDWIDRFTDWHVVLLKAFDNPVAWAASHGVNYRPGFSSSLSDFTAAAFPDLARNRELCGLVWADLQAARLLDGGFSTMMSENGWQASRTTELGKQFLRLIEGAA